MKRTWKNMVAVLEARAKNARAVAGQFEEPGFFDVRQSFLREARTLESVIKMITDKETFDFMVDNYDVKEVQ